MTEMTIDQAFDVALEHHRAGRLYDAEHTYRWILQRDPGHSDSVHLIGVVALQTGNFGPALELVKAAVELRPDAAIYRNSLGQVLEKTDRLADAENAYAQAIELDRNYAEPHNNLGHLLTQLDRLTEAETHCREAIRIEPEHAEPHTNLGNVLKARGELDAAIAEYRRAVELRPDLSFLHSNLLLTLHYHPDYSPDDLAREHRAWADRHVAPLASERWSWGQRRRRGASDRRLRVGYVSPDFREHSVARFILPILKAHDKERFEIFAYSDVTRPDEVTARIREHVDRWRDVGTQSDEQLSDRILSDQIDILVDLAAHSARNRLLAFARKPAPVQVTYLAYCSTTGVDAIDYRLTDRFLDPPDSSRAHYVERSFYLPGCYWCYSAPDLPADRLPSASRLDGPPTFGCLNNFAKVGNGVLEVWARLLQAVPGARLLLHAAPGSHRERVRALIEASDLPPEALTFVDRQPFADYLETYRRIDVALDPFPFTGGTTTCDALWMGVPVVSLTGATAVSRGGSTLLSNAGVPELVADSEDRYVELAAGLMRDRERLAASRAERRERFEASPVMDIAGFVEGLESALGEIWRS